MAEDREKKKIQVELFFWHPGKCLAGWKFLLLLLALSVAPGAGVCPVWFLFPFENPESCFSRAQVLDGRRSCSAVASRRIWENRKIN